MDLDGYWGKPSRFTPVCLYLQRLLFFVRVTTYSIDVLLYIPIYLVSHSKDIRNRGSLLGALLFCFRDENIFIYEPNNGLYSKEDE